MLLVPTVVALYKAHVERLARINAAAIRVEPKMVPVVVSDAYTVAVDKTEETRRKLVEERRVKRELAAEKKKIKDLARGVVIVEKGGGLNRPVPFFSELLSEVSRFYDIPILALKSIRRDGRTAYARQVACYVAYKETSLSFPAIGRLLGNRDHTTILHGVRKIERLLAEGNDDLAVAIITIKLRLGDRVQARVNHLAAVA